MGAQALSGGVRNPAWVSQFREERAGVMSKVFTRIHFLKRWANGRCGAPWVVPLSDFNGYVWTTLFVWEERKLVSQGVRHIHDFQEVPLGMDRPCSICLIPKVGVLTGGGITQCAAHPSGEVPTRTTLQPRRRWRAENGWDFEFFQDEVEERVSKKKSFSAQAA